MAEVEAGSVEAGNPGEADVTVVPGSPLAVTPQPTGWIESVADPATKEWAIAKGLQNGNFENVLGSYHNLEKMVGADKAGRTITLLGDDASPEDRATYFNKLGRPEKAEQYTVSLPEGSTDDTRLTMMRNKAHELGISDAQFSGLAEADGAYMSAATQGMNDKAVVSAVEAEAQLRTTWGAAYDQKVAGIDVAAHKLGIGEDQLNGLREAMGPVDAMKFVDGLNSKIGDHNFDSGEAVIPGHKTPDQAKIEMSELSMNKEFMDAWMNKQHPGHGAAVEKKSALARLTTGMV